MNRRRLALVLALAGSLLAAGDPSGRPAGAVGPLYTNPVVAGDAPDPFVLRADGRFYAYATGAGPDHIQVYESTDATRWTRRGDAYPRVPAWAVGSNRLTWAPAVLSRLGYYVLYVSVRERASGRMCITRGVSPGPAGPFVDDSTGPMVCQREVGGSIDPSPFVEWDGSVNLLWKSDGNCCALASTLWSQRMTADGLGLVGQPVELLRSTVEDRGVVENPAMVRTGGSLHLLFSTGEWSTSNYAIDGARCDTPQGPCRRVADPALTSNPEVAGPGGAETFVDRTGSVWVAYHAWKAGAVGYGAGGARSMRLDRLVAVDGGVRVIGPTTTPAPAPLPG